jgi:hypothetical protein
MISGGTNGSFLTFADKLVFYLNLSVDAKELILNLMKLKSFLAEVSKFLGIAGFLISAINIMLSCPGSIFAANALIVITFLTVVAIALVALLTPIVGFIMNYGLSSMLSSYTDDVLDVCLQDPL